MLLRSLFLVLSLQCFALTAAVVAADDDDKKAAFKPSTLKKPFGETLKTAKPKQRSGWWSQGTSFGPREQEINVTKEKTSKDGEKSENSFHKVHSNVHALEGVPGAAPRREGSWGGFENIASRGVDGSTFLKNEGEHGLAKAQSSLRHVGGTGNVSMVTGGRDVDMAMPEKPVKDEDKNGVKEQQSWGHETFTMTAPWDGGKNSPHDKRSGTLEVTAQQPHSPHTSPDQYPPKISVNPEKAQEGSSEENGTRMNSIRLKGTVSERFCMRKRVNERGVPIRDRKAEVKTEKMVVWENGKIEERTVHGRIDGDQKGKRMIMELEMLVGERSKGGKESKRMIRGGLGKRKQGAREQEMLVRERTKGEREGEQMIVKEQEMIAGARMKNSERMITGCLNETNEGIKKGGTNRKERQGEEVMTGENMKTRDRKYIVADQDDVRIRHQLGWLPSWIIKGRSKVERKERKMGNVVHIEMEKERDIKGFNMGSN